MRRFSAIIALMLLVAGCATIPSEGGVQTGGLIGAAGQTDVEYLPSGPTRGADQKAILDGFLTAGAAPQNNYRIARQFLTPTAAESWKPASETYVRGTEVSVVESSPVELELASPLVGTVDASGVFTPDTDRTTIHLKFGFEKINGQWRLSSVPDLTLLTEVAFSSTFNEYTVYYFSHDHSTLIPEVRLFARQADPVTAVARAVIAGPSARLPNAESGFPSDVRLATVPVDVHSGHAVVDLSEKMTGVSKTAQQEMVTEMNASLKSQAQIKSVGYTVNGVALPVEPIASYVADPKVDPRPLIVRSGKLGFATKTTFESVPQFGALINSTVPISASINVSYQVAAVQNASGIYRVNYRVRRVAKGTSLVDPQIGGAESVWWVDARRPNRIAIDSASGRLSLTGPWPRRAHIAGLEVSRDDARVAIAVNDGVTSTLYVAAIQVDASGRPSSLAGFTELPMSLTTLFDLAWADATHIAVLGSANGTTHVELASVGGITTSLGEPRSAVRISGGSSGAAGIVVRAGDGELWSPRGQGWQKLGIVANGLSTQN